MTDSVKKYGSIVFVMILSLIYFNATAIAMDAVLTWSPNTETNLAGYKVYFGTASRKYGTPIDVGKQTTYSFTGLPDQTTYFAVTAYNTAGNESVFSAEVSKTPPPTPDTTPPLLSSINASSITSSSAVITWGTNELSDSQVQFGTTSSYGSSTTLAVSLVTVHSQTLTGLQPSTLYHYRVLSKDVAGNLATSLDYTFTTAAVLPPPTSTPTTVTLNPAADTFLNLDSTNNSTGSTLNTYTWPANEVANAILMKFDLSAFPAGAVIQSATLNLSLVQADATTDATYTVTVHKIINKNPDLTKATGMTYDGTNAWTASSCCYGNVPLAEADITAAYDTEAIDKTPGVKSWNITKMVQEWISSPSSNFGLLLNSDATKGADRYRSFASMENATAPLRPSLTITYAAADTAAPVISGITAGNIAPTSATISWATNEASDTQIQYGPTTAYGASTTLDTTLSTTHSQNLTGLVASTTYHYRVLSKDAAGNLATSGDNTFATLAPPDTTPPSAPTGVTVAATSSTEIDLTWTPSTDNVGVAGYRIYRNGTQVGTTAATSYADTGLAPSTIYSYTVAAYDAAGNLSGQSAAVSASTPAPPDTTPPVLSSIASGSITPSGAVITWSTNEPSDTQVEYGTTTAYGASTALVSTLVTAHSQNLSGLTSSTLYHYRVKSRDAAGNLAVSGDATFTTTTPPDTTPPSVPAGLTANAVSSSEIDLTWSASSDNVGVVGYQVYRDGVEIGTTASPDYADTGLAANTSHRYTISAYDAAGNVSAQSAAVSASTPWSFRNRR